MIIISSKKPLMNEAIILYFDDKILPKIIHQIYNKPNESFIEDADDFNKFLIPLVNWAYAEVCKKLGIDTYKDVDQTTLGLINRRLFGTINNWLTQISPYIVVLFSLKKAGKMFFGVMPIKFIPGSHDIINPTTNIVVTIDNEDEMFEMIRGRTPIYDFEYFE